MRPHAQFFKFCLVGVLNPIIHYLTFIFLYRIISIEILIASAAGYLLGVMNSFFLNRRWTFSVVGEGGKKEFGKFVIVNILSLGVNTLILNFTVRQLNLLPEIGQGIAIVGALLVNFFGNKLWTFGSTIPTK